MCPATKTGSRKTFRHRHDLPVYIHPPNESALDYYCVPALLLSLVSHSIQVLPPISFQVCKDCFFAAFEDEVHRTIVDNRLFKRGDRVAIGASGGKGCLRLPSFFCAFDWILPFVSELSETNLCLYCLSIIEWVSLRPQFRWGLLGAELCLCRPFYCSPVSNCIPLLRSRLVGEHVHLWCSSLLFPFCLW